MATGAKSYAATIADEVQALEVVLEPSALGPLDGLTPEAVEMLEVLANQAGEIVDDYMPSFFDYVNAYGLEYSDRGKRTAGEWAITGAELLRTCGGPNCWITWLFDSVTIINGV